MPKKGAPSFLKFERSLPEASQLQDILSVFLNSRGEMVAYTR